MMLKLNYVLLPLIVAAAVSGCVTHEETTTPAVTPAVTTTPVVTTPSAVTTVHTSPQPAVVSTY